MSSAFERLQKLAEEKRLKEKAEKPRLEIVPANIDDRPGVASAVSSPSAPSAPSAPNPVARKLPVAPERDFTKVANSIVRQIPNGAFIGKSKQMYDYLYSLTRGAIKPARSVRVSKFALMRGSGIKSTHTFYNNVRHLEAIGLIITTRIDGERGGNSYEVFLPEEIQGDLEQLAHLVQLGQLTQPAQKLPLAVSAETALPALGSNPINMGVSDAPKTSFKTIEKTDDEPAALFELQRVFAEVSEKLTGKGLKTSEREKWKDFAELLAMELEIASARTGAISSVPAFFTEHLRRRLFKSAENKTRERNPTGKGISKSLQVGKTEENTETVFEEFTAEALTEESRQRVLQTMQEYIKKDYQEFVMSLEKTYTPEDWAWLMENLESEKQIEVPAGNSPTTDENS